MSVIDPKKPAQFGDMNAKHGVEIDIAKSGLVVWVNVDGVCALRIMLDGFTPITVEDKRK